MQRSRHVGDIKLVQTSLYDLCA